MDEFFIYTDGSCIGNPGLGGWGVVIIEPDGRNKRWFDGSAPGRTTNQRMEITAAIEGLRAIPPKSAAILRTDSLYVVNTMNRGWKRRANRDLWALLDAEVAARSVTFEWVPGHAGDVLNELADELAREASARAAKSHRH